MDSIPAHMRPERSFQGFILALQRFWADQGCVILQPYDMEMGAGTFHPATTLRALGPRPWKAAYVQPSRRPKDGRYGEKVAMPLMATERTLFGRRLPGVTDMRPDRMLEEIQPGLIEDVVAAFVLVALFGHVMVAKALMSPDQTA